MKRVETVMGIPMSVDIREEDAIAGPAAEAAFAVLRDADRRFSRYLPDSEVSRANRGEHPEADYSDDLREVLAVARVAEESTGGAFTARAADGSLDTDGVVKGWAAARAALALRDHGVRCFCLNAGGDVVVGSAPAGADGWNVGVRSPEAADRMLAVLTIAEGAVATSGAYERGEHIRDGRSGGIARELTSATVLAADLTTADVMATAVFALGERGVTWALDHGADGVLAVAADGRLLGGGALPFARA